MNGHDLTTLDAHFARTVAIHSASAEPWTVDYYGLDGARSYFGQMLTAFPDSVLEANDVVADGNLVVVRWTMRGTMAALAGRKNRLIVVTRKTSG